MFKSGPNYTKLKTNLRLIINRLKLLEKKKTEMALKSRKEIADYISAAKDDRARIRVEHIIREDYLVEAMELLEMYCDLLLARFGLIQTQKELDPGLEEAIATIIWATPRLQADVQELKAVTEEFTVKYSKEFAQACRGNQLSNVNEKPYPTAGMPPPLPNHMPHGSYNGGYPNQPPAYNSGIHSAPPGPPNFDDLYNPQKPAKPPGPSVSAPPAPQNKGNDDMFPELPTVPNNTLPDLGNSVGGGSAGGDDVDFDDLTRRFEQLKKKK
uniref:IST1 homolog n=1 Tax=Arion vulgaris TaxID=1028688 RepID=A0A0B7B500_9EUPU